MDVLAHMTTFVRVVETGSLTAAARALRVSLPAVSRQLKALEDELATPLVARSTRKLAVTDAGRRYYAECVRVLRQADNARDAVSAGGRARGSLVVSAPVSLGMRFVVPKMAPLVRSHPDLSVELRLEDRIVDLAGDAVDIAVRGNAPIPDSNAVIASPLFAFRRHLVAAPAYVKKRGVPKDVDGLATHDVLAQISSLAIASRWELEHLETHERRTLVVQGVLRSNAPVVLRDLALDAGGIALLPEWLVEDDVAGGRLKRLLPAWASVPFSVWTVHRAELRGSLRVKAFLDAIRV